VTRQNRAQPDGAILAHPARGLFMGNRGCLHDAAGGIRHHHRGRRWITCLTAFKGRRRALMQPGRYTELFFLDEAVACAAGHRPCAECRRADFQAFQAAWTRAFGGPALADHIDRRLQAARWQDGAPARTVAEATSLPPGAIVRHQGQDILITPAGARLYHPGGYRPAPSPPTGPVQVLTPAPLLAVMAAGWQPAFHPSAG
jgi:hypothetical protein